jgi:uncharacterized protein
VLSLSEDTGEDTGQRFLVDLMLMRLGRWLRLLGQDVALPKGKSDAELLLQAKKESRTIITRDKWLFQAAPGAGASCLLIRSSKIADQLLEMAEAGVPLQLDPKRCTVCNGLFEEIESRQGKRWRCQECGKLYWQGGHWKGIKKRLEELRGL